MALKIIPPNLVYPSNQLSFLEYNGLDIWGFYLARITPSTEPGSSPLRGDQGAGPSAHRPGKILIADREI